MSTDTKNTEKALKMFNEQINAKRELTLEGQIVIGEIMEIAKEMVNAARWEGIMTERRTFIKKGEDPEFFVKTGREIEKAFIRTQRAKRRLEELVDELKDMPKI